MGVLPLHDCLSALFYGNADANMLHLIVLLCFLCLVYGARRTVQALCAKAKKCKPFSSCCSPASI